MFSQTYQKMILFFLSSMWLSASAFDITHILGQHPELSTFSNYLTQTNLAQEINARQTITVLAVANGDMGPLAGKPMDQIKKILSVHVLLDYYDIIKLKTLREDPLTVATLLQASGQALAVNNQGFINITFSGGQVGFGSAASGVGRHTQALLVKPVEADPYSISVLQISAAIIPSGNSGRGSSPPPQIPIDGDSPTQDGGAPMQSPPPTQSPPQADHAPAQPPKQDVHAPPTQPQPPKQDDHAPPTQPPQQDDQAPSAQPPKQDDHAPAAQSPTTNSPTESPDANSPTSGPNASPSESAPSPSDGSAPEPSDSDAPSDDDDNSPSPSPTGDSPSTAPSRDAGEEPSSADGEEKKKKSAGGMIVASSGAAWISAIILSMILGQLV